MKGLKAALLIVLLLAGGFIAGVVFVKPARAAMDKVVSIAVSAGALFDSLYMAYESGKVRKCVISPGRKTHCYDILYR